MLPKTTAILQKSMKQARGWLAGAARPRRYEPDANRVTRVDKFEHVK